MDASKKVIFIKDWILSYVNSMPKKAESLVIGISGGIDSSVSSTLSAMTGLRCRLNSIFRIAAILFYLI